MKDALPPGRTFLLQGMAVIPSVGDPFQAISFKNVAQSLAGHDPVTMLEASGAVLHEIENERSAQVLSWLSPHDQRAWRRWQDDRLQRGHAPASATPLHPLAVLAAMNLAMSQSVPAGRSDADRYLAAQALCRAATQFNGAAVEGDGSGHEDGVLAAMAMSVLWRSMQDDAWSVWSAELLQQLAQLPIAASALASFNQATGLSLLEWHSRTLGEHATRKVQGPGSWNKTEEVDPDLETRWRRLIGIAPDAVVAAASDLVAVDRKRRPVGLVDPAALGWVAKTPVVIDDEGARFPIWLGGLSYALLPATIATTWADQTGLGVDRTAALMGEAAGSLLTSHIESVPAIGERRIPEQDMPAKQPKCDYLLETDELLVGIEFTVARPPASLATGKVTGVDRLVQTVAAKMSQAYATFQRVDPSATKRHLPLVVFASPNVVEPLMNERVHAFLVESGQISGESELMTCHAPEFHDLVAYAAREERPLAHVIRDWRNSKYGGANLDWWLADRAALGISTRARLNAALAYIQPVLTRSATA
jgi:hypothetical protein